VLDRVNAVAYRGARWFVWGGGALMIFAAFMVTTDVILRKCTGLATTDAAWVHAIGLNLIGEACLAVKFTGADEMAGYLFAISTTWALGFALLARANVRIDALYMLLPRPVAAVLDVLGLIVLTGFAAVLTYRAGIVYLDSIAQGTVSITPLQTKQAIPQTFWFAGLAFFFLVLTLVLSQALWFLMRWDIPGVLKIAGARSHEEEVADELHLAEDTRTEISAPHSDRET
jgi:TRAP-type C4-dicarboxylate transport system permease small subunit